MATDAALLALVAGDDDAIRVLAAWGALEPALSQVDDDRLNKQLQEIAGVSEYVVKRSLIKLKAARVLTEGGISDWADKLLQAHVQKHLAAPKKGRR